MNNYDLPLDLIIEILSWLPVRSLVRFKCVSKSWYDLIKDPTFIKLHLHRSLERNSNTYIIDLHCCKPCNPEHISIYSFRGDYKQPYYQLAQLFLPKELELALSRSRIHGSCNGLLCISTLSPRWNYISLSLYNPATRAMKRLPPLCPRINPAYMVMPFKVALAYDCVSDDYKVFTSLMLRIRGQRFKFHKTMLYSLKSDAWEDIHSPPSWNSGLLFQSNRRTILTNNSLHWLMTESKIIRCFDLITQRCYDIPFPDTDTETRDSWYSPYLMVLRGQLCMVMRNLDIWILKEYGKPKSWMRIFHDKNGHLQSAEISDFWNDCSPRIGCIKDGHSVMLVNCKAKDVRNFLICCDLKSEEARKIEVPSLPELRKPFSDVKDMEPWVESLVALH